ncbi:response regulator transcription factor [Clostridium estertheticum]|uniref:response regulator transcription factor n=1 Tax=Clostridium estertheticum TaxID=238834 RepID=UPI001C7CDA74|nr:response regulator transcription factor [Clostridium estertheticum]MBX4266683.1 response regulator transcription factor [Clostridium estertheticum]MBX4271232.1 response regulator transcription factor [Clostridium estertheticum]WLC81055.1 response regulator transcription factor [Clostridium estertheticum]WLC88195.1 response regulator transcription factor [Clostridium estertheticum]
MKKILIIEDELSIAELERDYLEINDFSVDIEVDGILGLKAALNKTYNLIILDLMLPQIDGFEICRQIRSIMDVPILMVSAKNEDIDKIRGLGLGADDYMTKPFSPGELVARVKAHISRYERLRGENKNQDEIIEIRGLSIYRTSRRVYVNGSEVILTAKEFDILTILALTPNKVFSKNDIFDKVWGMDSFGDVGTVTVHIRKLREKIEADPSNPLYIETIWGVGYRFEL